jgi:hypothetical protein
MLPSAGLSHAFEELDTMAINCSSFAPSNGLFGVQQIKTG